ncbi:MAG: hypothetical protein M3071_22515, partial [Actinomycetota bacterium]|nr:hypothetical protein [Actinomycetota bacterium]
RDPTAAWRVSDLAVAIVQAGWLADTDEAQKRISDMASVMVADSQLVRVARGTYGLAPELGAAFELRRRRSAKENLPSAELEPQD